MNEEREKTPRVGIGYTVGELTVAGATPQRKGGYTVWKCRCSCGGEILLDTRCLQRGTVRDCGCKHRLPPGQRDLSGMRFGRLICMEPAEGRSSKGGLIWRCQCDCGNTCLAVGRQLVSGYKKSCGCLGHPLRKELVGKRFGQLTVTEYAGKQNGMHRWKCVCDCGMETVVGQTLLQSGKTKSCGCLQREVILDNLKLCEGTSVTILQASKERNQRNNKSGRIGVYQDRRSGRWVAQITFKRKTYYLGSFEKMEDAVKARQRGEEMFDDFLERYYETANKEGTPV